MGDETKQPLPFVDLTKPYAPSGVPEDGHSLFSATDVPKALYRGAEQTVGDLYRFADWGLGGGLPDWPTGESAVQLHSWAGELGAGAVEGTILGMGVGSVARATGLGRGALQAAQAIGVPARAASVAAWAAQGGAVDFLMSSDGAGFSRMLQHVPSTTLQSIGNVLGSSEGDSELTRRLKGMLEGFFVGGTLNAVVHRLVRFRSDRRYAQRTAMEDRTTPEYPHFEEDVARDKHWADVAEEMNKQFDEEQAARRAQAAIDAIDQQKRARDQAAADLAAQQKKKFGPLFGQKTGELLAPTGGTPGEPLTPGPSENLPKAAEGTPPAAPGMLEPGNIDLTNRPVVKNPDGSISTISSVGVGMDGKEYLLPTISDSGERLTVQQAIEQFRKTGKHLGAFDTPENATAYAKTLSAAQGQRYGAGETSSPGAAASGAAPEAAAAAAAPAPLPELENLVYGSEAKLVVKRPTGGTDELPVKYAIVDADSVIPSHDAREGFARNPQGDVNERPYHDPAETALRQGVFTKAEKPMPELVMNNTPSPTDGPPIMRPSGVVLGGNSRAMAQQLAYSRKGSAAQAYRRATRKAAEDFGIDPAQIKGIKNPMLVRVISEEDAGPAGALSRSLNESLAERRTVFADAHSRGARLTPEAARDVASVVGEGTLAEVWKSPSRTGEVLRTLIRSGVVSQDELAQIMRGDQLTNAGRESIEYALLGSAVPDVRTLNEMAPATRQLVIKALPAITRINAAAPDLGFQRVLTNALDGLADARTEGSSVERALKQKSLVPQAWKEDPQAIALMKLIESESSSAVATKLRGLADQIAESAGGQGRLFGEARPTPDALMRETFGEPAAARAQAATPSAQLSAGSALDLRPEAIQEALRRGATGADAFVETVRAAGGDVELATRASESIGRELFGHLTSASVEGEGGAYLSKATEAGQRLLMLGRESENGTMTGMHELGHFAEDFVGPEEWKNVVRDFEKAKARAADPAEYEFKDAGEWFAEKLARRVGDLFTGDSGFTGLVRRFWNAAVGMFDAVRAKLGIQRINALINDFLEGNFRGRAPLNSDDAVRFSEEAFNNAKGEIDNAAKWAQFFLDPSKTPGLNPRDLTPEQLSAEGLERWYLNEKNMTGPRDAVLLSRWALHLAEEERPRHWTSPAERDAFVTQNIQDLAEMTGREAGALRSRLVRGTEVRDVENAGIAAANYKAMFAANNKTLREHRDILLNGSRAGTDPELLLFQERMQFAKLLAWNVDNLGGGFGRELNFFGKGPRPMSEELINSVREKIMSARAEGEVPRVEPAHANYLEGMADNYVPVREILNNPQAMKDRIRELGGRKAIMRAAQLHFEWEQAKLSEVQLAAATVKLADLMKTPNFLQAAASIFARHLLSGPQTWGAVAFSEGSVTGMQPARHWMGAFALRALRAMRGDDAGAKKMMAQMAGFASDYGDLFSLAGLRDALKAGQYTMQSGEAKLMGRGNDYVKANLGSEVISHENFMRYLERQRALTPNSMQGLFDPDTNPMARVADWFFTKGDQGQGLNYSGKLDYLSTRPLSSIDTVMRTLVVKSGGRSILRKMAADKYPTRPDLWEAFADSKTEALVKDGMLATEENLQFLGQKRAYEQFGVRDPDELRAAGKDYAQQHYAENPDVHDIVEILRTRSDEAASTLPYEGRTGQLFAQMDKVINDLGWPKFILPFLRSSYSLTRSAFQHIDVPGAWEYLRLAQFGNDKVALAAARSQFAKDMLSGNPFRQAEAAGRLTLGALTVGTFMAYAAGETAEGLPLMTGQLSNDPKIRALQERAGLKEYSFWAPGIGYVSYKRIDPVATILGVASNLTTYGKVNPQDESGFNVVAGAILSVAKNLESKTYLSAITNIADALREGNLDKIMQQINQTAISSVPVIGWNLLATEGRTLERLTTGTSIDVEVRGLTDELMSRVPFWRSDLPAQRDLFGQPLDRNKWFDAGLFLPFAYNQVGGEGSRVHKEMVALGHAFGPPASKRNGIDLRDLKSADGRYAYDYWQEQVGEVTVGGVKIQDAIRRLIETPAYRALPRNPLPGVDDKRVQMVNSLIGQYRAVAWQRVLTKFPELRDPSGYLLSRELGQRPQPMFANL